MTKSGWNRIITGAFCVAVVGSGIALVASIWGDDTATKIGLTVLALGVLAFAALLVFGSMVTDFDDPKLTPKDPEQ